ncbi:MAG: hypothetical protein BWY80_01006 [Firmicutes bacterium ADurb.Bin456]|nr:MAG: hypothetical protein BWY80_01006 [Firmicutes bacterium ADurb.Bin456]
MEIVFYKVGNELPFGPVETNGSRWLEQQGVVTDDKPAILFFGLPGNLKSNIQGKHNPLHCHPGVTYLKAGIIPVLRQVRRRHLFH